MKDSGAWAPLWIADDSKADRHLMERAFREAKIGNPLYFARDGQELLDQLHAAASSAAASPPGLILMDLNMPRMDGRETLTLLRADPILAAIPVLILSTSDFSEDVLSCYRLGANSVLVKPFSYSAFVDLVSMIKRYWLDHVQLPAHFGGEKI